ncbi:MAG TPA: HIT domain-containing protein, partial [Candidatus Acidoferrales bacterium]|nr:HIT domain-containing protein [Candidatus Acidoferrales bacterium]
WLDAAPDLLTHLMSVSHSIGQALQRAFKPARVGLMIAGLEVPHLHIHLVPVQTVHDLDFANQDLHAKPADLDRAADTIRTSLRALGFSKVGER